MQSNEPPCSFLLHIPRKVGQGREEHRGLGGKSLWEVGERGNLAGRSKHYVMCVGVGDDAFALNRLTVWDHVEVTMYVKDLEGNIGFRFL